MVKNIHKICFILAIGLITAVSGVAAETGDEKNDEDRLLLGQTYLNLQNFPQALEVFESLGRDASQKPARDKTRPLSISKRQKTARRGIFQ